MRGKRCRASPRRFRTRITPAGAGKTLSVRALRSGLQDHPRGCGENLIIILHENSVKGSPPRMRGKLASDACTKSLARITPADAGKTQSMLFSTEIYEDHPRGCGENYYFELFGNSDRGSPPRMRGKLPKDAFARKAFRITPADAGKTLIGSSFFFSP